MKPKPIKNHIDTLTLMLCKAIYNYQNENPSVAGTAVIQALSHTMCATAFSIDDWYDQVVEKVGEDVTESCTVPEIYDLIDLKAPYETYWDVADDDDDDDEEDEW